MRLPVSVLMASMLVACSPPEDTPTAMTPNPDQTVSQLPPSDAPVDAPVSATGFYTLANAVIPSSAVTKAGDVPRDEYGRPFTYEGLGQSLAAFEGELVGGGRLRASDLNGQWTVIDVWGLWCGDCLSDSPHVAALARAIDQDPDLAFVSIHTPPSAARAGEAFGRYTSIEVYFEEKGFSYPTLVDPDASIRAALAIRWTPTYLLVAPDGTVQGFRSELSAASGEPVKDFIRDIAEVRGQWQAAQTQP